MIQGRENVLKNYIARALLHWKIWNGPSFTGVPFAYSTYTTGTDNLRELTDTLAFLRPGTYSIKYAAAKEDPEKPVNWAGALGTAFEILASEANSPATIGAPGQQVQYQQRMYTREEMDEKVDEKLKYAKLQYDMENLKNEKTDWPAIITGILPHAVPLMEMMKGQPAAVNGQRRGLYLKGADVPGAGGASAPGSNVQKTVASVDNEDATIASVSQEQRMNGLLDRLQLIFNNDEKEMTDAIEKIVVALEKDPSKLNLLKFL